MAVFQYDTNILTHYPTVVGGVILAQGMTNGPTPEALNGAVTVHFADGSERYTTLGQDELEYPEPGEVVFSDDSKLIIARRWCWRQSDQSAAQQETTQAIFTVEAHHSDGKEDIDSALNDLLTLLGTYAGGIFIARRLDATNSVISA